MRRSLGSLALGLVAALGVSACSASDNGGVVGGPARGAAAIAPAGRLHDRLPASVAAAGVLRVGSAVGRPPLIFYGIGTHQPEGMEYDLMVAMARQLGLAVRITDIPLADLGPQLLGGKVDVLMSGFVDLKAFEGAGIDFVDYFSGRSAVLVRQGNPLHISGPAGLCGRSVGLVPGTAQQVAVQHEADACTAQKRPAPIVHIDVDHAALATSVARGRLDAVVDDAVVAQYTAQVSAGADTVEVAGSAVDPLPYGIGVSHSAGQLRDAVRTALQAIISDGEYDQVLARWGGEASALRTAPVNAGP